jgi:maltose alpha-D-glucosyltransferase/alpha-amylase
MIDRTQTDWYRDALIYQVNVKSFFDSTGDGLGDFPGLTEKLDYIHDLGATAVWLMPFFPSPLRDDGYDISDYREINPAYGTLRDFRAFVRAAHDRNIRVIIELVINHTSDQHPWFQRARRAKPGSNARDFYVWSDTDKKFAGVPIVFRDVETSNWTWDPVAQAYYWHRFYSHQPDLNFDNPRVLEAVISTMRFWFDMGVDGLRLDAIPYLVEREGTNCASLPETHEVIKKIRAVVDADYPDRLLLAEANMWPEEMAQFFGDGDECHMVFHFPLMPRMYIAIAQEDRHPITDIMRQTPEIPEGAQWAIFLRNHDELTLEMVTDKERDYLWSFYASDQQARINLGIRRRLAPLLENDRRKMELMNSLLLSMPGTPVLYYGDEIGMGDNIYLGDRNGVRTPMQWSQDRNGGFSRADPERLFLPAIQDPIYGFESVNVEAQLRSPSSLLNWTRRMTAIRRNQPALGRGTLRFLYPTNRRVLAYLREFNGEHILCVANLSRGPQAVELDLSELKGLTPIELTGGSAFPHIADHPFQLTLTAYGFFWFSLKQITTEEHGPPPAQPELFTLVLGGAPEHIFTGRERAFFESSVTPAFLQRQRWAAGKPSRVKLVDLAMMKNRAGEPHFPLTIVAAEDGGTRQDYFLPLVVDREHEDESLAPYALARVRRGAKVGLLYDAGSSGEFVLSAARAMSEGIPLPTEDGGEIRFRPTSAMPALPELPLDSIRRHPIEQNTTSISLDDAAFLKIYRRLVTGRNPDVEIRRYLTEKTDYVHSPRLFGSMEYRAANGAVTDLATLEQYVGNQGDAWEFSLAYLTRELDTFTMMPGHEAPKIDEVIAPYLRFATLVGTRLAELHAALGQPTDDPAFAPEKLSRKHLGTLADDTRRLARTTLTTLGRLAHSRHEPERPAVNMLLERREECLSRIVAPSTIPEGARRTRIHGDFHLARVLVVKDEISIIDFAHDSSFPGADSVTKHSPLRDVASLLRSFGYVVDAAVHSLHQRFVDAGPAIAAGAEWRRSAQKAFRDAYRQAAPQILGDDPAARRLLMLYELARAFREIADEAEHRPDRIETPVRVLLDLLDDAD